LEKRDELLCVKADAERASSLAYELMGNSSKIGAAGRFVQESLGCNDDESLCKLFFQYVQEGFGMRCVLKYSVGGKTIIRSSDNIERPLENEIITTCKPKESVKRFGIDRALLTWKDGISLLVNNLSDDADNISLLLDGFCASMRSVQMKNTLLKAIRDIQESNKALKIRATRVADTMTGEFNATFDNSGHGSNLTQEEEEGLIAVIDKTRLEFEDLLREGTALEESLNRSIGELYR